MEIATVTSKGQVTVPKRIRDFLGLDTGAKIIFVQMEDGSVRMVNADRKAGEAGSLNEMRESAAELPAAQKRLAGKTAAAKRPVLKEALEETEKTKERPSVPEAEKEEPRRPKRKRDLNSYLL